MSKIIDDKKEVELETKSKDLARHIRMCSNLLMKKNNRLEKTIEAELRCAFVDGWIERGRS